MRGRRKRASRGNRSPAIKNAVLCVVQSHIPLEANTRYPTLIYRHHHESTRVWYTQFKLTIWSAWGVMRRILIAHGVSSLSGPPKQEIGVFQRSSDAPWNLISDGRGTWAGDRLSHLISRPGEAWHLGTTTTTSINLHRF